MSLRESYELLSEELASWAEAAVASLPNLAVAIVVATAFYVVSRFAASFTRRLVERASGSKALEGLASATVRYAVIVCGLFIALGVLGLQKTVFSLLAGAGIAGLAIGFAFQDLAANFISGVFIAFQRPFAIGEIVEAGGHMGRVREIELRTTTIETFSGQLVVVPNRDLFENPLTNFSRSGSRRIELEVGVAYDTDLEQATSVARRAIEELPFLAPDGDVAVLARSFGGSSIDFSIRYWIEYPDGEVGYLDAIHRGVVAIKQAFDDADIEIPFPIRTLDFSLTEEQAAGIKLTEPLAEAS